MKEINKNHLPLFFRPTWYQNNTHFLFLKFGIFNSEDFNLEDIFGF